MLRFLERLLDGQPGQGFTVDECYETRDQMHSATYYILHLLPKLYYVIGQVEKCGKEYCRPPDSQWVSVQLDGYHDLRSLFDLLWL